MSDVVNWGVLGYARIAKNSIIPAITRAENARLYGVASRNQAELPTGEWAQNYGDYAALLADPAIQAVYIPLPNSLHKEWVIRALAAGKHVLCEKPIGLNAAEAQEMQQAAIQHNRLLMEAFMYQYTDRVRVIKQVLESGVLGELRHINVSFRFLLDRPNTIKMQPTLGGGALYDVGCYPVNFVGMVTGRLPTQVRALCETEQGVDTNLSALLQYDDGLIANIHCGFNAFGRNYAEIIGSKGMLIIDKPFLDDAGALHLHTAEGVRELPVSESDRYQAEIRHFSSAVLNQPSRLIPLTETVRNMQVLDQIRAAL
ncbi:MULTISPECIES: Gfo/Idh/MocA family protein [Enterobacteriaceae]|uniref:Gfo/Idh/MocA family oxidoreductase n=1 Tax=Kluyvera genomosp. 2 TaxID=2774054 RepID=A0A2T2XXC1_9ENTR|nr:MULTISPECIES: Gfo/Idh/MocA family oxidoreductase [Enterobacteriaceae]HAT3920394.1 Gfo/Idh/MocA family oxidoreductase [Kluyvera ascorbata]PSR44950.1 gfo/Idh/MocA family oxidoreductase [Kluyvera genomosp. 2]BBQ83258.1 oxidoreductase [Klebsiella sp. WP3-W18-ESBL-02]BBR20353.1 oxidoreductase [Klebsiella sp. WP3-S18-ESBL-05]BBR59484.1 oxidoreductase [Klebsiella sp. WP4-W18-ESBL-05]